MVEPRNNPLTQSLAEAGALIRARRQEQGLTLTSVAKRMNEGNIGVSLGHLSTIERAVARVNRRPSLPSLPLINSLFDAIEMPEDQRETIRSMYGYGEGNGANSMKKSIVGSIGEDIKPYLETLVDRYVNEAVSIIPWIDEPGVQDLIARAITEAAAKTEAAATKAAEMKIEEALPRLQNAAERAAEKKIEQILSQLQIVKRNPQTKR